MLMLTTATVLGQTASLGQLKNLRLGMTLTEARASDETTTCQEPRGRITSCLLYISVAQVTSKVVLELVNTGSAVIAMPKAPAAPQYEGVPRPTAADRRNGTLPTGADEAMARNNEKKRKYAEAVRVYESAKHKARAERESQFKVARIHVSFVANQYAPFREAYIAKFGQPTSSKSATYRNAMNATFEGAEDTWKDAETSVALYERCESIDRSCLVVDSIGLAPYVQAARNAEVRERADDL